MSSAVRYPSQIAPSGTYVATADLSGAIFTEAGVVIQTTYATGTILYDMGKTVRVSGLVLRRVQVATTEGNGATFYIIIGGNGSDYTPVARL